MMPIELCGTVCAKGYSGFAICGLIALSICVDLFGGIV